MKKLILLMIGVVMLIGNFQLCSQNNVKKELEPVAQPNPFFTDYNTPYDVPPFEKIKEDHYLPAFIKGIEQERREIEKIANNSAEPTFENTIVAMEKTGPILRKVSNVFYNLNGSNTNEEMQKIAKELSPMLSKHNDEILLNAPLFQRIKTVYDKKDELNLTEEQNTLLKECYKQFVRGGANLNEGEKAKLMKINEELSMLSLKFGENILKETNTFELIIDNKDDLSGLTESVIMAAAETAKERGHDGKWAFTLHKPSLIPFLQYSDKRELREKMLKGYINRGNNNDELDNKKSLSRMAALRVERANLLGYKTHADYILEENMAKKPENVYALLNKIWEPALEKAKQEAVDLQKMIDKQGGDFKLQPWDWWYYAEKLKKEKYALDDELLRPYFQLENVIDGAFGVATKLYGITFEEIIDIPVYYDEVRVFELKEADGSHIGILYTDYFPRASKRGGAWMNSFRKQSRLGDDEITPVICNVCNFSKPAGDKPSLLSLDEVETLFHEFGHALHGLLSDCTYRSLSGTSVSRDFVELPSQFMENFAVEPTVLKSYAKHYKTGEPIPDELIEKIEKSSHFNQGFATTEYLAASFLDMDWHTLNLAEEHDALEFEKQSMSKIGLIPEIVVRYRSYYFNHIFSGGYSSGYYAYIWSEWLDADAFQAFKETSLFDQKTAKAFRKNVLSAGGTEDPMVLYKRFRGAEPKIEALLERRGLK